MDGSLTDFDEAMISSLNALRSDDEEVVNPANLRILEAKYPWLQRRMLLIKSVPGWWLALKPIQMGFVALQIAKEIGFRVEILTKGPKRHGIAWHEKLEWCQQHVAEDAAVHIVSSKGGHYGKVLYDDYPEYLSDWLAHRPRGLAIMPVTAANQHFSHPNCFRWDGDDV